MHTPRIGHIYPMPLPLLDGTPAVDKRALEALTELNTHLGSELILVTPGTTSITQPHPSTTLVETQNLPFRMQSIDPTPAALDELDLALTTTLHADFSKYAVEARTPCVLTSEFTYQIRLDAYRASLGGPSLLRAAAGLARVEAGLVRQVMRSSGVQFNGRAAARAYGPFTRSGMMFHDSRIRRSDVDRSMALPAWGGAETLRVGFSGRLDLVKGPQYAIRAAEIARQRNLPVELHVFGTGPMEERLRAEAGPNVIFHGFMDFRTEWLDFVREHIDLMLFPHVQGDPSCTYFEALGSGAPILAFDNVTATPLTRDHGVGWTVPQGDVEGLVGQIERILADAEDLALARDAGHAFMAQHTFEMTTRRRAKHLEGHLR